METQEERAKDQKYQALETSEVKEKATMKRTLFENCNESPSTPNGKAHKTQQPNTAQLHMFMKHLPDNLGTGPGEHFAKNSRVNKNSFHYIPRRK